jgi:3'(2'), 5'-bisphosphate nucleotidase
MTGTTLELSRLSIEVEHIARRAGVAILEHYQSATWTIRNKDNKTPVTEADLESDEIIRRGLRDLPVKYPIVSEESFQMSFEERQKADRIWCVDPLDGTEEFLSKNGEFCVCVALLSNARPILGVIHAPVSGRSVLAVKGQGVYSISSEGNEPVRVALPSSKSLSSSGLKVAVSRSHLNDTTAAYLETLRAPEKVSMGSALKFCGIALGEIDVYPRFAPTMEWDTAAGDIIVHEAGGRVYNPDTNQLLQYNKEILTNPSFIAMGPIL